MELLRSENLCNLYGKAGFHMGELGKINLLMDGGQPISTRLVDKSSRKLDQNNFRETMELLRHSNQIHRQTIPLISHDEKLGPDEQEAIKGKDRKRIEEEKNE